MQAVIDLAGGCARIAGARFELAAAGGANVRLGGSAGLVLRPLRFGERSLAVQRAASAAHPPAAAGAAVLEAATVRSGEADELAAEVVALLLAGGDIEAAPFDEAALAVAGAGRLGLMELLEAEASLVDRLALTLVPPRSEPGEWNSIRFEAPSDPGGSGEDGLRSARDQLAERLLERARVVRPEVGQDLLPEARARAGASAEATRPDSGGEQVAGARTAPPHAGGRPSPSASEAGAIAGRRDERRARDRSGLVARAHAGPDGDLIWSRPLPGAGAGAGATSADAPAASPTVGDLAVGGPRLRSGAPEVTATAGAGGAPAASALAEGESPAEAQSRRSPRDSARRHPGGDGPAPQAHAARYGWARSRTAAPVACTAGGDAQLADRTRSSIAGTRRGADPAPTGVPAAQHAALWAGGALGGPSLASPPAGADELAALLHDEADLRGLAR